MTQLYAKTKNNLIVQIQPYWEAGFYKVPDDTVTGYAFYNNEIIPPPFPDAEWTGSQWVASREGIQNAIRDIHKQTFEQGIVFEENIYSLDSDSRSFFNGAATRALIENAPQKTHRVHPPKQASFAATNQFFINLSLAMAMRVQNMLDAKEIVQNETYSSPKEAQENYAAVLEIKEEADNAE